jgi:hypothetical protein
MWQNFIRFEFISLNHSVCKKFFKQLTGDLFHEMIIMLTYIYIYIYSLFVHICKPYDDDPTGSQHVTIYIKVLVFLEQNGCVWLYSLQPFFLFFFLSFLVWPLIPNHCRSRGLLLHTLTLNDTHIHTRARVHAVGLVWMKDRSVAETSTWQHTIIKIERHPCPWQGLEPVIPTSERLTTYALDREAIGIGLYSVCVILIGLYSICRMLTFVLDNLVLWWTWWWYRRSLIRAPRSRKLSYRKRLLSGISSQWRGIPHRREWHN